MRNAIHTDKAPGAIGSYSQAVKTAQTLYLSGQIPLNPKTGKLNDGDLTEQVIQVFENLKAVAKAANASLDQVVRLGVFLTNLSDIKIVNEVMKKYFQEPFPARTSIEVKALPMNVPVEIDAILEL